MVKTFTKNLVSELALKVVEMYQDGKQFEEINPVCHEYYGLMATRISKLSVSSNYVARVKHEIARLLGKPYTRHLAREIPYRWVGCPREWTKEIKEKYKADVVKRDENQVVITSEFVQYISALVTISKRSTHNHVTDCLRTIWLTEIITGRRIMDLLSCSLKLTQVDRRTVLVNGVEGKLLKEFVDYPIPIFFTDWDSWLPVFEDALAWLEETYGFLDQPKLWSTFTVNYHHHFTEAWYLLFGRYRSFYLLRGQGIRCKRALYSLLCQLWVEHQRGASVSSAHKIHAVKDALGHKDVGTSTIYSFMIPEPGLVEQIDWSEV